VFVNRTEELAALAGWWDAPGARLGMVWGRRRVGKTALLQRFASERRTVFHVARGAPPADELTALARRAARVVTLPRRIESRGFADWGEALEVLADAAGDDPLLVVLDEFPELVAAAPHLESQLRAVWQELGRDSPLRLLLCGSAVRTMTAMVQERAPLYGRFDLLLQLHPFPPHEAAAMLPSLDPADRAVAWGVCGGMPLYLSLWDAGGGIRDNLLRLFGGPGAPLLTEAAGVHAGRPLRLADQDRPAAAAGEDDRIDLRGLALARPPWADRDHLRTQLTGDGQPTKVGSERILPSWAHVVVEAVHEHIDDAGAETPLDLGADASHRPQPECEEVVADPIGGAAATPSRGAHVDAPWPAVQSRSARRPVPSSSSFILRSRPVGWAALTSS
jgi:hypothetical protein